MAVYSIRHCESPWLSWFLIRKNKKGFQAARLPSQISIQMKIDIYHSWMISRHGDGIAKTDVVLTLNVFKYLTFIKLVEPPVT